MQYLDVNCHASWPDSDMSRIGGLSRCWCSMAFSLPAHMENPLICQHDIDVNCDASHRLNVQKKSAASTGAGGPPAFQIVGNYMILPTCIMQYLDVNCHASWPDSDMSRIGGRPQQVLVQHGLQPASTHGKSSDLSTRYRCQLRCIA